MFNNKLFSSSAAYLGLDVGSAEIKLVEVRGGRNSAKVVGVYRTATPPGAVSEGEILNPLAVLDALEGLVKEHKLQKKPVIASIAGRSVINRQVRMPVIPDEELAAALRWETEKYLPLPFDEVVFDYVNLGTVEGEGGKNLLVLIAAAPIATVEPFARILVEVGLKPLAVEILPVALWRLIAPAHPQAPKKAKSLRDELVQSRQDQGSQSVACLDIGAHSSNIVFFKDDILHYNRSIHFGGRDLTNNLSLTLGVPPEEAEIIKRRDGIILHEEEVMTADPLQAQMDFNLRSAMLDLVTEIKRSLDFFAMQAKSRVDKLYVTGGTAQINGIHHFLEEGVGLPVEIGDCQSLPGCRQLALQWANPQEADPSLAVSLGLALREVID